MANQNTDAAPAVHLEPSDDGTHQSFGLTTPGNTAPFIWKPIDFTINPVTQASPFSGMFIGSSATRAGAAALTHKDSHAIQNGDTVYQSADEGGFVAGTYEYVGGSLGTTPVIPAGGAVSDSLVDFASDTKANLTAAIGVTLNEGDLVSASDESGKQYRVIGASLEDPNPTFLVANLGTTVPTNWQHANNIVFRDENGSQYRTTGTTAGALAEIAGGTQASSFEDIATEAALTALTLGKAGDNTTDVDDGYAFFVVENGTVATLAGGKTRYERSQLIQVVATTAEFTAKTNPLATQRVSVHELSKTYRRNAANTAWEEVVSTSTSGDTTIPAPVLVDLSAPAGPLAPGTYIVDTSGGAFADTLDETAGTWTFVDLNESTLTNTFEIGTPAQTFTDPAGNSVAGPVQFNVGNGHQLILYNVPGGTAFKTLLLPKFLVSNQPPVAAINAVVNGGNSVTYSDASTDADGTIVAWDWDLGGGATSTNQNPGTIPYGGPGPVNVTLVVTDNEGATDSVTIQVIVT